MAHITIEDNEPTRTYSVGASRSEFEYPFPFFNNSDLIVTVGGVTLTLDEDYTVTGTTGSTGGYPSGVVTLDTAVSSTTVVIDRVLPIERTVDFQESGPLDFRALNTQLDKGIAIDQQLRAGLAEVETTVDDAIAQLADMLNAETDGVFYSSRASAEAADIVAGTSLVFCGGQTAAADHGGGWYKETLVQPAHDLYFAKGGRYYAFSGFSVPGKVVLTPEMFGSEGTYATDGPALIAMALMTETLGTAAVEAWEFKPGKTYKIWNAPNVGGQNFIFSNAAHTGLAVSGLKIKTNGCKFESSYDWAIGGGTSGLLFHFRNAVDLDIDEIYVEQTVPLAATISDGIHALTLSDACRGVSVRHVKQIGGGGSVFIDRSSSFSNQERGRGYEFRMIEAQDVYYVLNPQFNGDFIDANVRVQNAGRAYFCINASHHKVRVDLNESRDLAQIVNIACECGSASGSDGENKVTNLDLTVSGTHHGNVVNMQMSQREVGVSASGVMHNIDIKFRLGSASGVTGGSLVNVSKTAGPFGGGGFDSTARGHSLSNITISGVLQNIDTDTTIASICTDGDWTGEFIENIGFRDLVVSGGGAFNIDGEAIDKNLFFENVDARGNALVLANVATGVLNIGDGVGFTNIKSAGFVSGRGFYRHLPNGRVLQYGTTTTAGGAASTDQTLPVALRSASAFDNYVLGSNNYSGGTPGFSVTIPTSTKVTISRADTTGNKDCGWSVEGYSSATGSPEP
ncbi:MAG: hypothetical protein LC750_00510 [Actinobacteria bacterium]|nr:hypothetical protein [Actinomycetota bacterium]